MDDLINSELHPTELCIICSEAFSTTHQPVAIRCRHIFGEKCLKRWLHNGRGNTNACPCCRHTIIDNVRLDCEAFDAASIWKALCEQPQEQLHDFMFEIWRGVQKLWQINTSVTGNFTVTELLNGAIIPALLITGAGRQNTFTDCRSLVVASWDSLGRPDQASGLAIPLIRLARLMSQCSSIIPKWLTSVERINMLFWDANADLGLMQTKFDWNMLIEAANMLDGRYFGLLCLFTVLMSQNVAHNPKQDAKSALEKCVRIGAVWSGSPSSGFREKMIVVYEELRRHQLDKGRLSLRAHQGESNVVKGLWSMAAWKEGSAR